MESNEQEALRLLKEYGFSSLDNFAALKENEIDILLTTLRPNFASIGLLRRVWQARQTTARIPEVRFIPDGSITEFLPIFNEITPLSGLKSLLTSDLPFPIPITSAYSSPSKMLCSAAKVGYKLLSLEWRVLSCEGNFPLSGSRHSCHSLYDFLIKDLLYEFGRECGLLVEVDRDVCDPSNHTQRNLRPDFLLWVNGVLLLKGEEESESSKIGKAIDDLTSKLNPWVPGMNTLPYVLCYAAVRESIRFFAIDPSNNLHHLEDFILDNATGRLRLLNFTLNIVRLFRTFVHSDRMPAYIPAVGSKKARHGGVELLFLSDHVTKTIPNADIDFLTEVYSALSSCPFTVQGDVRLPKKKDNGTVKVDIRPLCRLVRPPNISALWCCAAHISRALKAFHDAGFVHRDVRWENILYSPDGSWLLCDFEAAARKDVADVDYKSNNAHPPEELLCGGIWTPKCDFFQLGLILRSHPSADSKMIAIGDRLCNSELEAADEFLDFDSPKRQRVE
eukprot:GILJ01003522.1.p1 GENE.GILJ01003522.1~~GILJ01003522.1.p1  ORF type:complete len:525 (+),score=46.82 GILJ01003522.1:62-1576(+)